MGKRKKSVPLSTQEELTCRTELSTALIYGPAKDAVCFRTVLKISTPRSTTFLKPFFLTGHGSQSSKWYQSHVGQKQTSLRTFSLWAPPPPLHKPTLPEDTPYVTPNIVPASQVRSKTQTCNKEVQFIQVRASRMF